MFQHVFVPDCSGAWQGAATASCQVTSRRNCFAALLSCRQPSGWQNTNLHPLRGDARGREGTRGSVPYTAIHAATLHNLFAGKCITQRCNGCQWYYYHFQLILVVNARCVIACFRSVVQSYQSFTATYAGHPDSTLDMGSGNIWYAGEPASDDESAQRCVIAAIPLPARQTAATPIDIPLILWYFSSIIARPYRHASTLTIAYSRKSAHFARIQPRAERHVYLHIRTKRCRFCHSPCHFVAVSCRDLAAFATHNAKRQVANPGKPA